MASSFFFYDLETSGFDPRGARIMQFAGHRTDLELNPIGEPVNLFIKLTPDVLPEPDAVLVTGITPQQTINEGVTEQEFLKYFYQEVVKSGTIFVGFNSIRFDDEFMRFLHYRNLYDPYEWHFRDSCSRWDLLDAVRMTRALRPEGIEWPFAPDGKPANRLEYLTKVNKLDHYAAHDALSDVYATIAVAKLLREKQKNLFEYLLGNRNKKEVSDIVSKGAPFIYASGRYPSQTFHTTAAVLVTKHPHSDAGLVYDLRHDPSQFLGMTPAELVSAWKYDKETKKIDLPIKTLKYNHCPAVAPLGVIKDEKTQERIDLSLETVTKHMDLLRQNKQEFAAKLIKAVDLLDAERAPDQTTLVENNTNVDSRLYDGFVSTHDKTVMRKARDARPEELSQFQSSFQDARLKMLLPLYKARNFPHTLSAEERKEWDEFCTNKLLEGGKSSKLAKYFSRLEELDATTTDSKVQYLLEELQLYGQSIMPVDLA